MIPLESCRVILTRMGIGSVEFALTVVKPPFYTDLKRRTDSPALSSTSPSIVGLLRGRNRRRESSSSISSSIKGSANGTGFQNTCVAEVSRWDRETEVRPHSAGRDFSKHDSADCQDSKERKDCGSTKEKTSAGKVKS